MTPLDLVGPLTILRTMGRTPCRTVVVGDRVEELVTDTPPRLLPNAIVPGGGPAASAAIDDDALVGHVRSVAAGAEPVGSTGNGASVLAAADLLQGKRAERPASTWHCWPAGAG